MAPNLTISQSNAFSFINQALPWNTVVSEVSINSICLTPPQKSSNDWNRIVSPAKRNNIKLLSNKKSWNEINSLENINALHYDKIQRPNVAVPSRNIINISVMSNKKKQIENFKLSELRISFDKTKLKKEWNEEFDQKVTRNGDFFVSKIQRPENKLICTQNFTVRSISHSLEKKSNSSCDYKTCRQVSFSKEGEEKEKCSKIDCKCKCHIHSRYI